MNMMVIRTLTTVINVDVQLDGVADCVSWWIKSTRIWVRKRGDGT